MEKYEPSNEEIKKAEEGIIGEGEGISKNREQIIEAMKNLKVEAEKTKGCSGGWNYVISPLPYFGKLRETAGGVKPTESDIQRVIKQTQEGLERALAV